MVDDENAQNIPASESEVVSEIPVDPALQEQGTPVQENISENQTSEISQPVENKTEVVELTSQISTDQNNPNITIEKSGNDVTITEVMAEPKAEPEKSKQDIVRELAAKARAKRQEKKRVKLDKLFQEITEKGKITNDEVEKLLHVSDPTATRYLDILEKEGKIRQVGKTGKHTHYERI